MKKLAILGASAVLAALPVVGVFAASDVTSVEDTINVTVDASCTLGIAGTHTSSPAEGGKIANGAYDDNITGPAFKVSCNDHAGWKLTAVGSGAGDAVTDMKGSQEGTKIETGTSIDGSASNWALKASGTGVEATYENFAVIPGTATKIAGGSSPVSGETISVTYGVSVGAKQDAGTYTGKVTYTLAQGQGE